MPSTDQDRAPAQIRVSPDRRTLTVVHGDGALDRFPAELLRVLSPSAEVQGHSPEQRVTVGGKRDVAIRDVQPVGRYAIRIVFDDGHDTGLYTWRYLSTLGVEQDARWSAYLSELSLKGLRRDPN
jgi:DUF971 family protein